MIEGPGGPAPKGSPTVRGGLGRVLDPFHEGADRVRRWFKGPRVQKDQPDAFLWQLQLAGRAFWVILGGLIVYLVVDLWVLQPKPPTLIAQTVPATASAPGAIQPHEGEDLAREAAEYRNTLAARNPFRLSVQRLVEGGGGQTAKAKLQDLIASLAVVGINRGTIPEALVEDSQAKKTYFLKVGDQVNGLTVKAIDQNGVAVTYEGEETTLQ